MPTPKKSVQIESATLRLLDVSVAFVMSATRLLNHVSELVVIGVTLANKELAARKDKGQ